VKNRLLAIREHGQIVLLEANPAAFKGVATHKAFEGMIRAYPALAAGTLYVRNVTNQLIALSAGPR
jgi:hypothetical protein